MKWCVVNDVKKDVKTILGVVDKCDESDKSEKCDISDKCDISVESDKSDKYDISDEDGY